MKSEAQICYEKVQNEILSSPGMVEESERRLLFKHAFASRGDQSIVEFGAFFGASSLSLLAGANAKKKQKVICIDAYEVSQDHRFCKHVISIAQRYHLEKLLEKKGNKINWRRITEKVIGEKYLSQATLIESLVDETFNFNLLPNPIGLLHLDLPKDADTLKPILDGSFTKLSPNSVIAFQDYAYHFSNELICFFRLLEKEGIITPVNIAASSIFYKVKHSDPSKIKWQEYLHTAQAHQSELIRDATIQYKNFKQFRKNEITALKGAEIVSLLSKKKRDLAVVQQIENLIFETFKADPRNASRVLSQILSEKIETHR